MRIALLIFLLSPITALAQFAQVPPSILPATGAPSTPIYNNFSTFNQPTNFGLYNQTAFRQVPMFQSAYPYSGIGGYYPQQTSMFASPFMQPSMFGNQFGGFGGFGGLGGFGGSYGQPHIGLNFNLESIFNSLSNLNSSGVGSDVVDDEDYVPRHHVHHHHDDEDADAGREVIVEERPVSTAARISVSHITPGTPFSPPRVQGASLTIADPAPVYHYADESAVGVSSGEHIAAAENDDTAILPPAPIARPTPPAVLPATQTATLPPAPRPVVRPAQAPTVVHTAPAPAASNDDIIAPIPALRKDQAKAQTAPVWKRYFVPAYQACQREGRVPMNCQPDTYYTWGERNNPTCHTQGLAVDIISLKCGGHIIKAIQSETAYGKPFHDMVACMQTKMKTLWHQHYGRGVTEDHYDNFHLSNGCIVNGRHVR